VIWPWLTLAAWGGGWAVASLLLPLSARLIEPASALAVFAAALVVGAALVGWPNFATARGASARYPAIEAAVWVLLLAATVTIVVSAMTSFDPINAVTTEDIRARRHGGTWPYPPELVLGLRDVAAFCLLAGLGTSLLNGGARGLLGRLVRAACLGIGIAAAFGAAILFFVLAGPFVWRLFPIVGIAAAGFLSGCVAGAGMIPLRRRAA
jgi:hypothetical protein